MERILRPDPEAWRSWGLHSVVFEYIIVSVYVNVELEGGRGEVVCSIVSNHSN